MRVALIGPELEENLGLEYLDASIRRAGHESRIFDFHSPDQTGQIVGSILDYAPDVVGLSLVFTGRAGEFVALAERLREAGFRGHVTAGGHFASFHARDLLSDYPAIDSIVHGEGEEAIVDLIDGYRDLAGLAGITYRDAAGDIVSAPPRRNPDDLDSRPFPTRPRSFHSYLGKPIANILSSRGCYANCHFCSINAWYRQNPGKRYRQRDVAHVAREMAQLYHERGCRIFNFHDDNFFLPDARKNVDRFLSLKHHLEAENVGRIGIQVKARPDDVNARSLSALKDMGLFRVFLGVESNAVAGLKTLGRGITREQNHRALAVLRRLGLHVSFNLLMFDPETTLADLADNIGFIRRYADIPLNFGRVEVYSGTALERRLRSEGRLLGDYFGYSYRISDARAQRVFEIFHKVFLPRNFDDGALNFAAMRLDYYFHILRHFFPARADGRLEGAVRKLIAELNLDSAALLERACDFAAGVDWADPAALEKLAANTVSQRAAFDAQMGPRMERVVDEIKRRARSDAGRSMIRVPRAAAVAATALIVAAAGCEKERDRHMREMLPRSTPTQTAPPAPSPTKAPDSPPDSERPLSEEDAKAVEERIKEQYSASLIGAAWEKGLAGQRVTVALALDEKGNVKDCEITMPAGFETSRFKSALAVEAKSWTFPSIKQAGSCTVTLALTPRVALDDIATTKTRDIHMFERMMSPMTPKE